MCLPADSSISQYITIPEALASETIVEPSEEELRLYALTEANRMGVSFHEVSVTIGCESGWDADAIGDGGDSRGLVQIHGPSWPDITEVQAHDPYFAIDFLIEKFSEGEQKLWSCWRKHFM